MKELKYFLVADEKNPFLLKSNSNSAIRLPQQHKKVSGNFIKQVNILITETSASTILPLQNNQGFTICLKRERQW